MKKIILAISIMLIFSACSSSTNTESINVYNWGEYIEEDVLELFEQETGIKVNYQTFQSNEEMYAKIKSGSASYDVIIPSDYMIDRMIDENMLEALNFENIPNYDINIKENFKNPEYDEENLYSVPYTWGTVGIIYNKKYVKEPVDSWDILWDEAYKGQVLMFNNPRDAIAIALKKLGYSLNTTNEDEIKNAANELIKQKDIVQAYVMDQIFNKLPSEEAYIAPYYAGDAITMIEENENLEFIIPKEGTNRFTDAMCIPVGAKNKENAEKFINFMTRQDISDKNIEYIGYSSPMNIPATTDIEYQYIQYPSNEILKNTETFINLPKEILALYDKLWIEIFR